MLPSNQTLKALLIPTPNQGLISFIVALLILVVTQGQLIFAALAQQSRVEEEQISYIISQWLIELSRVPFAERAAVGLFWAVVASIVYVIAVAFNNAMISARNEVVIETQFTNKGGRKSYLLNSVLLRLSWLTLLLGAIFFTATIFFPQWMTMFRTPFIEGFSQLWLIPISVVGLTTNVYIIWVLALAAIKAPE